MKKITIILCFLLFLTPFMVSAMIIAPTGNIYIAVRTDDEDELFNFDKKFVINYVTENSQNFSIQTADTYGVQQFLNIQANGPSDYYTFSENPQEDWSIANISCVSNGPYSQISIYDSWVRIRLSGFESVTCTFDNTKRSNRNPVLIVPGVMGTDIKKGEMTLWANPVMTNPIGSDNFMDPLQFEKDLKPSDDEVVIDKVIGTKPFFNYTGSLIDQFTSPDIGYIENETLFTFPYDWRYGVSGVMEDGRTVTDALKEKIQEILGKTGSNKVDIVAHSTGGLLVKKYVMENFDHRIDKAVFVGVPNLGSPKAVKVLLSGDNFGIFGLSDEEMKKIAQNMPVVYDLAPSEGYYDTKGSYLKVLSGKFLTSSSKELNYQEVIAYLKGKGLNDLALDNADALHSDEFDNFDLRTAGIDMYNIVGCKSGTLQQVLDFQKPDGTHVRYEPGAEISGDQTVPFESADSVQADDSHKFYVKKVVHSKMLSADGIRQQIVNILAGSQLDTGNKIITYGQLKQNPSQCELKGKRIEIHSPLDISVTDSSGNVLEVAEDGSIKNEIEGADFTVMDGHKFVYLPSDENQDYQINLNGAGEGYFTLKEQDIDDSAIIKTQTFVSIPVSTGLIGQLQTGDGSSSLSLDMDGDGNIDKVVEPSSVVEGEEAGDKTAPVTKVEAAGEVGKENYFRGDVEVKLAAADPLEEGDGAKASGVLKTLYKINGETVYHEYASSAPVSLKEEGSYELNYYSIDRAGNEEQVNSLKLIIDKTAPEAVLKFNPLKKDLDISGTDDFSTSSAVTVLDREGTVALTDEAGNKTELKFRDKDRKKALRSEIREIRYNGKLANMNKNSLVMSWLYDKNNQLKFLSQEATSKRNFTISVIFDGKKTVITGREDKGKVKQTIQGLKLLAIRTDKGELKWE